MVTFILGAALVAIAMLALSVGVIFNKRTPLKGHCHKPVDGSDGCGSCGDSATEACESMSKQDALKQGNFQIEAAPSKISLLQ